MYMTYGKVFGGTPNINFVFGLFPESVSISERTHTAK